MENLKDIYYSGRNALTYNCLFNFVIGNRGGGKTYWSKEWGIEDFLKNGKQFIYLRRYDTEFDGGKKEKFFDDIKEKYPEHEFKVKGYVGFIDKKPCVYFKALSKAKIEKSTPFPNVNKIIYDEFILDKGVYHYLSDEVTCFLEMYETVNRMRLNPRDEVRVFFLSNAITVTNPYFLYFGVKVNGKPIQRISEEILLEVYKNEKFNELKRNTRLGKVISGTEYGNYAIENNFLRDDNLTFIGKKSGNSRYQFTLRYNGRDYGVFVDYSIGKYFVSNSVDKSCRLKYAVTLDDHTVNTMLVRSKTNRILKMFTDNYKIGNVVFEDINIKNVIYNVIRLFLL